jgi:hypothetical protein
MRIANRILHHFLMLIVGVVCLVSMAGATENGGSLYPVGADSIAIAAAVPHKGQTLVYEYTCFYEANEIDDAKGHKTSIPDFKLRVFAAAIKLSHNWGVKFLGGEVGSWIAVPNVYQQLHVPGGKFAKDAVGNINIVPFSVMYHRGMVHWFYELQFPMAGSGYTPGATLNIGQHNIGFNPGAAITITPHHGEQEISSRVDYVINDADHTTHYHGGNEFFWQFDAREEIPHSKSAFGPIGYYYQQVTNDSQFGKAVVTTNADGTQSVGYKGRVLDLGGEVTFPMGKHGGMAFKWEHDMLVQNKTRGNTFWFQFGVPFSYLHHPSAE